MPPLAVLLFTAQGSKIRKAYTLRYTSDAEYLELFSRIIASQQISSDDLFAALESGIRLEWEDTYDFVNPFGDRRGIAFDSVWTFDLNEDVLSLTKSDGSCSVPLSLARKRALTTNDFELVQSPPATSHLSEQSPPGPFWEPRIEPGGRERFFLGRILQDFAHTWRHVLRRDMNTATVTKLAYATIWLSQLQFTLSERIDFEHVGGSGGPYIRLIDLPRWETPQERVVPTESPFCWFVISDDVQDGLRMVRDHIEAQESTASLCAPPHDVVYVVLTFRQVVLAKASGGSLMWTQSEKLFHKEGPASDAAIDMLLWAAGIS